MSATLEPTADLVAVACVVDASLLLASEWSRVLIEYVYPLLKRLNELHPSHQFRIAFVTYGAADTRPLPLLSKRYFAPLSHVTKELREEPSKLGIGQTNSGSGRGLSALEGLVAAIELFDILMSTSHFAANHAQPQSPQKENRSLISHLLHIAASPPDNAQRPQYNTLQHLDFVSWDSIPAELKKRKINLSLISLRKISQFQDLQSSVAGPGAQSPWFNVRTPHVLLLAGFPTPQKTGVKRQSEALLSDQSQSPDTKRQKVAVDPISKASLPSASPAPSPARVPPNQRPQQSMSSQIPQPPPTAVPGQNPFLVQPVQSKTSVPASTPATTTPVPQPPSGPSIPPISSEILDQVIAPRGIKFRQMMERLKVLDGEIAATEVQISNAQNTGQAAILAGLQKDLAPKARLREQIKMVLRHQYQKMVLAKEALNAQAGATGPALLNTSAEAGSSAQSHTLNAPTASSEQPMDLSLEERKPVISDSQLLAQFWKSRGGTISVPNSSNPQAGPSQTPSYSNANIEVAGQMQKLTEKKSIRPQSFGPPPQTSGTTTQGTAVNPNNIQALTTSTWQGTFSWNPPRLSGQVANKLQIYVAGHFPTPAPSNVRTDTWPKELILHTCKQPLKDNTELPSWVKRHRSQTHLMRFGPNPRAPDGSVNGQKFHELYKFMAEHRIYAYAGWQLPSGRSSCNIVIFPVASAFVGAVFPDGVPDLPGSGNTLNVQPLAEEAKPLPINGINFPPALIARMQDLEPATQRQLLAQFLRMQQQEQLRRQQLHQAQQPHAASSQPLNSLGTSVPSNPYGMVVNVPADLHANANASSGAYNTGGTVNYEMLQSFMQRNADGSTSQGMNSG